MWSLRQLKSFAYRWRFVGFACVVTYLLIFYQPFYVAFEPEHVQTTSDPHKAVDTKPASNDETKKEAEGPYAAPFNPVSGPPFFVEEVMTNFGISLKEKMTCNPDKSQKKKVLLSWNAGHGPENLRGCEDWHCEFTHDRSRAEEADAILMSHADAAFKRRPDQYVIYFSQESPVNSGFDVPSKDYFNMSLGFRHDTAASSPYGYTVKLAPQSYAQGELISPSIVKGKTKAAAWFVSHCNTNSQREALVNAMKKSIDVDVYGACGQLSCPRNTKCEDMLDKDYHFYIAFENSICKDYITEKLWNQGYRRDIIPVLLKRSLAEPFVPPNSFIAADDFRSVDELAAHMHYLMKNHTAYMEYFNWRKDYRVIFLNGKDHDVLERPWGFCQVCRLAWQKPKKQYVINDWAEYWPKSCEADGTLVQTLLNGKSKI